jgi:hypothetical protein
MADDQWLFDIIKKNLSVPAETPYEQWMTDFLRQNVETAEARAMGKAAAGGLLDDPEIQASLKSLSGEGEAKSVTLREDALEVLGEAADELTEEILDQMDQLVRRMRSSGGVIKADRDDDNLWSGILASQLAARIKNLQRKRALDAGQYREKYG